VSPRVPCENEERDRHLASAKSTHLKLNFQGTATHGKREMTPQAGSGDCRSTCMCLTALNLLRHRLMSAGGFLFVPKTVARIWDTREYGNVHPRLHIAISQIVGIAVLCQKTIPVLGIRLAFPSRSDPPFGHQSCGVSRHQLSRPVPVPSCQREQDPDAQAAPGEDQPSPSVHHIFLRVDSRNFRLISQDGTNSHPRLFRHHKHDLVPIFFFPTRQGSAHLRLRIRGTDPRC
jgi:hypothetical protein